MHTKKVFIIFVFVTFLSSCTTILRSDFESYTDGVGPAADIPGFPAGDRLVVSPPRYGSVSVIRERVVADSPRKELLIENRVDLSTPGWQSNQDGPSATRFISKAINFPNHPIGTTLRGTIMGSGPLDIYVSNETNCYALKLRIENEKILRLSDTNVPIAELGDLAVGSEFSLTVFVNRGENEVLLFTAGPALNQQRAFPLPECVRASAWERNVLRMGFVSPAQRGSSILIDAVEMSENQRSF